jgi:hypothetical protein
VIVIPSARLVIVRLGAAMTFAGDIRAADRLVADVLAAVKGQAQASAPASRSSPARMRGQPPPMAS